MTDAEQTDPAPAKSPILKWIAVAVALAAVLTAAILLPVGEWVDTGRDFIAGLGFWAPIAFLAFYILLTVLFVSGAALTLAAGAIFGLVEGVIYASIASTIGAALAFLIGRYLARDWVARKIEGNSTFVAIDRAVADGGWKIVGLTRLSPVFPFVLLNYAFGLTKVKFSHYLLASWIGMLPGTILYVYLGYTAQVAVDAGETGAVQTALRVAGLVATIIVTVFITKSARRALAARAHLDQDNSNQ